jgi:hypothetical protein
MWAWFAPASGDDVARTGSPTPRGVALGVSGASPYRPSLTRPPILPPKDPREDMRHHRERRKMEKEFERRNRRIEGEERARNKYVVILKTKNRNHCF